MSTNTKTTSTFENDWLKLPPVEVFKHDGRSRVWAVETPGGRLVVIKRFEYSLIRQVIERVMFIHPLQYELAAFAGLTKAGIPMGVLIASGYDQGRGFLVTEFFGESLQQAMYRGRFADPKLRHKVARDIGELIGKLWNSRILLRDFKAPNLLVKPTGEIALIDPAKKQKIKKPEQIVKMARLMARTAHQAGATQTDLMRAWKQALKVTPQADDLNAHMRKSLGKRPSKPSIKLPQATAPTR